MILSLYLMVICACLYVYLTINGFTEFGLIAMAAQAIFYFIASACYDRTIDKLKNEIRDLKSQMMK